MCLSPKRLRMRSSRPRNPSRERHQRPRGTCHLMGPRHLIRRSSRPWRLPLPRRLPLQRPGRPCRQQPRHLLRLRLQRSNRPWRLPLQRPFRQLQWLGLRQQRPSRPFRQQPMRRWRQPRPIWQPNIRSIWAWRLTQSWSCSTPWPTHRPLRTMQPVFRSVTARGEFHFGIGFHVDACYNGMHTRMRTRMHT